MAIDVFEKNVAWNIEQIAVQFNHAESVKTRARSGYYKTSIILASAVVEALAYKILEINNHLEMPLEDFKCIRSSFLSDNYKSSSGNRLSICERVQPVFKLTGKTDFKKVNEVCLKLKIFSKKLFNKIEKVRQLRNKIHIQGLNNIDRSYTKKQLEFVSFVMDELLIKIRQEFS